MKDILDGGAEHIHDEGDGLGGIVVGRNHVINRSGIAASVNHCDDRDVQAVGLLDGIGLLLDIDDEKGGGEAAHVADGPEVLLELRALALDLETLSLGEFLERTIFLHLVDGVHFLDGLADGREIGEHSTRPTLGHGRHVDGGRLLGDDVLSLFLGGDEEDLTAAAGHFLEHFGRFVDLHDALVQVDDVDAVLLVEDIRSHLRVPLAGEMTEVCTCIKQFLEISSGHNV